MILQIIATVIRVLIFSLLTLLLSPLIVYLLFTNRQPVRHVSGLPLTDEEAPHE